MSLLFIKALFLTLISVRILAHKLHDSKGYGTKKEKSKTLTALLRKKTGFDWNHIHIGFIIIILSIIVKFFMGTSSILTITLAIGTSLVLDQIIPLIDKNRNYFSTKRIIESLLLHVILSIALIYFS